MWASSSIYHSGPWNFRYGLHPLSFEGNLFRFEILEIFVAASYPVLRIHHNLIMYFRKVKKNLEYSGRIKIWRKISRMSILERIV